MKLSAAIDEFLRFCTIERQLSEHTLHAYAADLHDLRRFVPGGICIDTVDGDVLTSYLKELVSDRGLSTATVRRRFACLRVFFRKAAKSGWTADPFLNWEIKIARRKRLPRALSRPEITSLVKSVSPSMSPSSGMSNLATAIRLITATGIRIGELCKLRIEDVSPDGASLRVQGKGSRDRIAYISDLTLQRELMSRLKQARVEKRSCTALFLNRRGAALKPQSIRSKLRHHANSIGLVRRITPHMLRHTAATLLIEEGVDIRFVQRLLGHSSIATTEIYTHVTDEALRARLAKANVLSAFTS